MATGSYCVALNVTNLKTSQVSNLEMRLLRISDERTLKHMQGATQISELSSQMQGELDAIDAKLPDDPTSEEYRENLEESESVENAYTQLIENIRDQMEIAEEVLDRQQESVETRLEVVREEQDQWKELATTKAEENSPFK